MKIGEVFETLNEAINTYEHLDDVTRNCEEFECTLPKQLVDDIAALIGKLIVMVKNREI